MATWTSIPDTVLEPGKPIRSVDALALRDNPIAIAQGASGAPKVTENAISVNSIHGNRIRSGTITNTQIANMNAGKLNAGTIPGARIPTNYNGVGTYVFFTGAGSGSGSTPGFGETVSGSAIGPSNSGASTPGTRRMSGTWRVMGGVASNLGSSNRLASLAVRIS